MAAKNDRAGGESGSVRVSKALSWLLRHGAEKEGFTFLKGGFLYVEDILKHHKFKNLSPADIQYVVDLNDKQRFALEMDTETNKLKIRANQGHSVKVDDLDLTPVMDADAFPIVLHGTNKKAFQSISTQGLKRMNRNHIHFAAGEPGDDGVISGMRQSCSILVFVNLGKALQDGFQFFQSANGVLLCPGNESGVLPTQYFEKVLDRKSRKEIPFGGENTTQPLHNSAVGEMEPSAHSDPNMQSGVVTAEDLCEEFKQTKRQGKKNKKS